MQPLNASIRRKLYLQFLIFYLVSLGIFIIAVRFYYKIPDKQIEILDKQVHEFSVLDSAASQVLYNMNMADSILSTSRNPNDQKTIAMILNIETKLDEIGAKKRSSLDSLTLRLREFIDKRLNDKRIIFNDSLTINQLMEKKSTATFNQPK
jgi:hypothetical protein